MLRKRRREPAEFDVFLCCADDPDTETASTVTASLRRAGFQVRLGSDSPGAASGAASAAAIDDIPDFVLLLTPATVDALSTGAHPVRDQVARALATDRNTVRVFDAAGPRPENAGAWPGLEALAARQAVTYDPDRLAESLSILQHSLSSEATVAERHLMRRTRRLFLFAALCVLAGFTWQTAPLLVRAWRQPRPLPPVPPFALYWAGFAERDAGGVATEVALGPGAVVSGGDRIRVVFSPSADGYAYVVARDARGRVSVLFPTDILKDASRVRAGRVYDAPVESDWLTIDPQAGLDAIYVFASYDSLQNLEELVEQEETPGSAAERRQLVDQTIAGLLDGRHYQYGRRVWIGTMQDVDPSLAPAPGPKTLSVPGSGGHPLTHAALVQPGLVSALAEIKLRFAPAR